MNKCNFKTQILPNLLIGFVFMFAAAIYFWPALERKIINSGDGIGGRAAVSARVERKILAKP